MRQLRRLAAREGDEEGAVLMVDGDDVCESDGLMSFIETIEPDADGLYAVGSYGWCWRGSVDVSEQARRMDGNG